MAGAEGQAAALDRTARAAVVSRAELIRELIDRAIGGDPGSEIGLGDDLIAATVLTEGLELATLNVRHYPMFPGLARPFLT